MPLGKFYVNKARAEIGDLFTTDNRYVYLKTDTNSASGDENLLLPHLWTMYGNIGSGTVGLTYRIDDPKGTVAYVIGDSFAWPWGDTAVPFRLGVM